MRPWLLVLALLFAACGGEEPPRPAQLTIDWRFVHDEGAPMPMEGFVQFVELRRLEEPWREPLTAQLEWERPEIVDLLTGEYEVTSYSRDCDGNCEYQGHPTRPCKWRFTVEERSELHVRTANGQKCSFPR